MRVGSHVSIRNGYLAAAKTAVSIGADAYQFFSKNPRSLSVKEPPVEDTAKCKMFVQKHRLSSIIHSSYPVNLAAEEQILRKAVVQAVRNDLLIADACGAQGVVVHFGHYKGKDTLQGYKNILQCIYDIFDDLAGEALLLMENQAHPPMGTTIEELVQIRNLSGVQERIGFCLDTCHAFASGMLQPKQLDRFVDQAWSSGYMEHLRAVHLNDSAYPAGAGKDRHAHLGQGYMGKALLQQLLLKIRGLSIPLVLETPDKKLHPREIEMVRQWLST